VIVVSVEPLAMSLTSDPGSNPSQGDHSKANGRYRICAGQFIDPNDGVHPEMLDASTTPVAGNGIPNSPQELIAMQDSNRSDRPEKPVHQQSEKVRQVLDLIEKLDTTSAEDQQIALSLVRHLERFHDDVVEEMQSDSTADHKQLAAWAIDADRMMRSRMLLESVNLE